MMGCTRPPFLADAFDSHRYEHSWLSAYAATPELVPRPLPLLLPPLHTEALLCGARGRPSASSPPAAAAPAAAAVPVATSPLPCASTSRRASPEPPASAVTSAHGSPAVGPASPAAGPATAAPMAAPPAPRPWTAKSAASLRWPSPAPRPRPAGVRKPRAPKPKVAGQSRYWTPSEHRLFVEALSLYGTKDLKAIAAHVATRNQTQVRTHAQKWSMRLVREAKRACLGRADMQALVEAAVAAAAAAARDATASPVSRPTHDAARRPFCDGGGGEVRGGGVNDVGGGAAGPFNASGDVDVDCIGSKCSVPAQCGMALLCLVGQDTMPAAGAVE